MSRNDRHATGAFALLVALTAASFWCAEFLPDHRLAIGAIMLVAAIKVSLVLGRFMRLGEAGRPVRIYFPVWTAACAAIIYGLAWAARAAIS